MKTLKGNFVITKSNNSSPPYDNIHITLDDESTGMRVVEMDISLEKFAKGLMSSYSDCEFKIFPNYDILGYKQEIKTEEVFIPESHYKEREEVGAKALEPFEVDGWVGNKRDTWNHHRWVKGSVSDAGAIHRVSFHRFVPQEENDE